MNRQEYHIVDGYDKNAVITEVNKFLVQGWELHGDLGMTSILTGAGIVIRYAQALVRDIEVPGAWG